MMKRNQASAFHARKAVTKVLIAGNFTPCALSSSLVLFFPLRLFHCFYLQPVGNLKDICFETALTLSVVNAIFPIFLSHNFIKLPQGWV